MKMTCTGWRPVCAFRVEAKRIASQDGLTFVRLLPEDFEPQRLAEHAVITKNSKMEFLEAAGILDWHAAGDFVSLTVDGDLWLKVCVDGREGWIHTQEDSNAIGSAPERIIGAAGSAFLSQLVIGSDGRDP